MALKSYKMVVLHSVRAERITICVTYKRRPIFFSKFVLKVQVLKWTKWYNIVVDLSIRTMISKFNLIYFWWNLWKCILQGYKMVQNNYWTFYKTHKLEIYMVTSKRVNKIHELKVIYLIGIKSINRYKIVLISYWSLHTAKISKMLIRLTRIKSVQK